VCQHLASLLYIPLLAGQVPVLEKVPVSVLGQVLVLEKARVSVLELVPVLESVPHKRKLN